MLDYKPMSGRWIRSARENKASYAIVVIHEIDIMVSNYVADDCFRGALDVCVLFLALGRSDDIGRTVGLTEKGSF